MTNLAYTEIRSPAALDALVRGYQSGHFLEPGSTRSTVVDPAPSMMLLNQLLRCGYSKAELAIHLGCETADFPAIRSEIAVEFAGRIALVHSKLLLVPATRSRRILVELRAEGFRESVIAARLSALAIAEGLLAPDLPLVGDRILSTTAILIKKLYDQMTA